MTIHPGTTTYTVKIHDEDGSFWAEVEELPGCFASGGTMDELQVNVKEAISIYLADGGEPVPVKLDEVESVDKVETQRYLVCT